MANTAYHGRGIVLGLTTDGEPLVGYFAQGRSPPSRQRRLERYQGTGRVYMNVNSETSLQRLVEQGGNPDLLLYNAIRVSPAGLLVVSNGFQTDSDPIWVGDGREAANLRGSRPNGGIFHRILDYDHTRRDALEHNLCVAGSEVDSLRTARIATVMDRAFPIESTVGMVVRPRKADGSLAEKDQYAVRHHRLAEGEFILVCTYDPSPSRGEQGLPHILDGGGWIHNIRLDSTTPEDLVRELYEQLNEDLMVGAAAAIPDDREPYGFRFVTKNTKV